MRQGVAVQVLHAAGMLAAAHVVVQVGLAGGGNATGVAEELQEIHRSTLVWGPQACWPP